MISLVESITAWTTRRPKAAMAFIGLVTLLAAFVASSVRIDADLARLLPEHANSVRGLERVAAEYGDEIGRLTLVLDGKPLDELKSTADALEAELEQLEAVDRVTVKDPRSELAHVRLLYMDLEDVDTVTSRVRQRIRDEKKRANPLFIELDDKPLPPLELDDIEAKYRSDEDPYYETNDGRLLVFVHPNFPASNLSATRELLTEVHVHVDALAQSRGIEVGYTGRYQKRLDQQELLEGDLGLAAALAISILFAYLLFYFRSWRTLVLVLAPLASGTLVAVAAARLVFGDLNILTAFLLTILLGMGIDYGIHVVDRIRESPQTDPFGRSIDALRGAGRANAFAALTTIIGLGSLALSDFRAFHEFGVIASLGILAILVAYVVICPPLLAFVGVGPARRVSDAAGPAADQGIPDRGPLRLTEADGRRAAGPAADHSSLDRGPLGRIGLAALIVATVAGIGAVSFDRSLDALAVRNLPSSQLDEVVNDTLGMSQTPAVVLTDTAEAAQRVVAELEHRKAQPGGETIGAVISRQQLLPEDQAAKLALYTDLDTELSRAPRPADSELAALVDELHAVVENGPLTVDDLPRALAAPLSRRTDGEVVLVMPNADLGDYVASRRFAGHLQDLPTERGTAQGVSEVQLLHEILELTEKSAPRMLLAALFGIFLVAGFGIGWRKAVAVTAANVLSFGLGLALLGLADVPLNFMNVIVLPIALGLGVDATFHREIAVQTYGDDLAKHAQTRASIIAAFITSVIGFAVLHTASHAGLRSVADVATLTLGAALLTQLVLYRLTTERMS